jgi:putative transcriptional regulator
LYYLRDNFLPYKGNVYLRHKIMRIEEQIQGLLQARHEEGDLAAGRLLIADPFLRGPYFSRSVVYLVEHDERGSVGFVLNKPLARPTVAGLAPGLEGIECPLHAGGPVGSDRLLYLHRVPGVDGARALPGGVYHGGDLEVLLKMLREGKARPRDVRFFVGYSGWDAGQLAGELAEHSWLTGDITPARLFSPPGRRLWEASMRALGGRFRAWAMFPEDPTMN